jgi:Zn-dependent alcohol dehydrogenase
VITTAAILWERGQPLSVEEVELAGPASGEVLVEVRAAGVCHSDLHPARDDWPTRTPLVLGHEGAGIVVDTGPDVSRLRPGDHVVFCWAPACGICELCTHGRAVLCDRLERTTYRNKLPSGGTRLRARGQDIGHFLSTACFAQHVVVAEEGAIAVPDDVPFEALATLGCAVVTGVGAATTAARVSRDASVVVIGAGGVGLNVIQGAALCGARPIVAVDRRAGPLGFARRFGATHTLDSASNMTETVRTLTAGGAQFVFDTVGTPETSAAAVGAARKGGTVIVTGLSRLDAEVSVPLFPLVMQEKRIVGSVYGSGVPASDIRRLVEWHRDGRLKLAELVDRTYPLSQVNQALAALANADGARGVILPGKV